MKANCAFTYTFYLLLFFFFFQLIICFLCIHFEQEVDLVQVIKKAKDSALRGGISGAIAMVANGAYCHITVLYRNVISKCPLVLIFFSNCL
jgi:hypothetical protein